MHRHAHRRVFVDDGPELDKRLVHGGVGRIEFVGAVQRDPQHAVLTELEENVLEVGSVIHDESF